MAFTSLTLTEVSVCVCVCQLLEALRREVPEIHIVGVELPGIGLCIRYAPLEIGDSQ